MSVEMIQIGDNEYRLSGSFDYNQKEYKSVIVDGEEYENVKMVTKHFNIDTSWDNKGVAKKKEYFRDSGFYYKCENDEWTGKVLDFMEWFDLTPIVVWMPECFSRSLIFDCYYGSSENYYASMLQVLDAIDAFKGIKGRLCFGKRDSFDKKQFDITIDRYGFNNRITFQFDFKGLIQHDLLKLSEHLDFYSPNHDAPHSRCINKIIKDYYQKTGSIDDSDRVNILANYIAGMY